MFKHRRIIQRQKGFTLVEVVMLAMCLVILVVIYVVAHFIIKFW